MTAGPAPGFQAADFEFLLRTLALGRPLEYHASIGSTNDRAGELARAGAPHGATVVAGGQQNGRGRHGRAWRSEPGQGLWTSVVLRPTRPLEDHPQVPLVVGLALADVLDANLGAPGVALRWPNDVDLRGRKVAGILCEGIGGPAGAAVVAGIGVNVGRGAVPAELAGQATSLAAEGLLAGLEMLLALLLGRLETRFEAWQGGGFAAVRPDYLARLAPPGRALRLTGADAERGEIRGEFETVDERGALVLRTERGPETFHAGQVGRVR